LWTERLAVATSACLLFLTLSGLSIWLLPFSVANQVLVLVHTAVGLGALVPMGLYLLRHWRAYRPNQMTYLKLLGYLGLVAVAACGVSGLVLTGQALLGPMIGYAWDTVHIVTTFAILAFAAPHVVLIGVRDWRAKCVGVPTPIDAERAHGAGALTVTAGLFAAAGILAFA
jgi:hypothetical protein